MYSLIIFDWDGTLSNSISRIVETMQVAAEEVGRPPLDDRKIIGTIGLGMQEVISTLYPGISDPDLEQVRATYAKHWVENYSAPSPLYEGVEETLSHLQERGYTLAVATGKSRRGLDRIFNETHWGGYFQDSRCADETLSKPHPQMVLELMQSQAVSPERTLVVGDTEFDLEMASRAGVDSVGVSYGAHETARLEKHRPVKVVDCISELIPWLENRLNLQ